MKLRWNRAGIAGHSDALSGHLQPKTGIFDFISCRNLSKWALNLKNGRFNLSFVHLLKQDARSKDIPLRGRFSGGRPRFLPRRLLFAGAGVTPFLLHIRSHAGKGLAVGMASYILSALRCNSAEPDFREKGVS